MDKMRVPEDILDYSPDMLFCRWEGRPFTGIAYEIGVKGQLRGETEYINGIEEGTTRGWYESGKFEFEYIIHFDPPLGSSKGDGSRFGTKREWFENGQISCEAIIQYSIIISEKKWDAEGTLIYEYEINEQSPNYSRFLAKKLKFNPDSNS